MLVASYYILKRPFIGVSLSIWTSLFTPALWTFGFSQSFRINFTFLALTFISIFIHSSKRTKSFEHGKPLHITIIFFFILGTLSTIFTDSLPELVWIEWDYFYKTILIYFLVIATIRTDNQIKTLLWCVVLSVSCFGMLEGVRYLVSGGGHQVAGVVSSKLGDRNAFSLALNLSLPFVLLLRKYTENIWLKRFLLLIFVTNVIAVLGTFSRGGLIGLLLFFLFFLSKSKNKILIGTTSAIFLSAAISLMPDSWGQRMNTIETADQDESFVGRVVAWKEAVLIANDHPFLGVGFKGGQNQAIWNFYADDFDIFNSIIDTSGFTFDHAKAAHSIYFQVLGDLGYLGLIVFLLILYLSYSYLSKTEKILPEDTFISDLSRATKNSLIVYCIAGAALSLPYFDISFILYSLSIIVFTRAKRQNSSLKGGTQ